MLNLLLLIVLGSLVGAATGLLAARWFLTHHSPGDEVSTGSSRPTRSSRQRLTWRQPPTGPRKKGRPEAAGIMADKLHLLYELGRPGRQS